MADGDDLARLLAEREIRRRLADYCSGIDRCDESLVASVFHADGRARYGGFDGTGAEFAAATVPALARAAEATMHRVGEPRIDWVDERTAHVETPVFAQHRTVPPGLGRGPGHDALPEGEPVIELFAGWYFDRFEHRQAAWRIADRVLRHAWDAVIPVALAFPDGMFAPGLRALPKI